VPDYDFKLQFAALEIPSLATRYEYEDDAECQAAGARARERGHYTRAELITVCGWKTDRSRGRVKSNTERHVVAATRRAFAATDERAWMRELTSLKGVAVRTASVLLHFAFPDEYPILDVRALESLGVETKSYSMKLWLAYLAACCELAAPCGVSIRTLDKALWQYSKESSPPRTRRSRCD